MATKGKPNVEVCEEALADVYAWGVANGLIIAASGEDEPVSEAEVVEIVARYEGVVDAAPFVMVAEPVFVERRKR